MNLIQAQKSGNLVQPAKQIIILKRIIIVIINWKFNIKKSRTVSKSKYVVSLLESVRKSYF